MKIHDVTVPLTRALPTYPGDPPFEIEALRSLEQGHPYRLSRLSLGTHTGTHVDAPCHFIPPPDSDEFIFLARRVGYQTEDWQAGARHLQTDIEEHMKQNRQFFEKMFGKL